MDILNTLGITVGKNTKASKTFDDLTEDFFEIEYERPSEYVSYLLEKYSTHPNRSNSLNGKIFEYILATLFIREEMLPLYMGAKVAFVPNVDFDLMFYTTKNIPICFSAKTSLRERYKQADFETIALKYVHRRAKGYLITLDEVEALSVKAKIQNGDVIGLDEVIVATNSEFDDLISELKEDFIFTESPTIEVFQSNQIITAQKVELALLVK